MGEERTLLTVASVTDYAIFMLDPKDPSPAGTSVPSGRRATALTKRLRPQFLHLLHAGGPGGRQAAAPASPCARPKTASRTKAGGPQGRSRFWATS